jgi:hypothetical protein
MQVWTDGPIITSENLNYGSTAAIVLTQNGSHDYSLAITHAKLSAFRAQLLRILSACVIASSRTNYIALLKGQSLVKSYKRDYPLFRLQEKGFGCNAVLTGLYQNLS